MSAARVRSNTTPGIFAGLHSAFSDFGAARDEAGVNSVKFQNLALMIQGYCEIHLIHV